MLRKLLAGVREALGIRFVGPYLTGSLAAGDFDRDSDVDFVVVTDSGVDDEAFVRLDAMHQRIATLDSWCASQLEGTHVSREALRRFHPDRSWHPSIERGRGERLKLARYDPSWVVHCSIVRERGIAAPEPGCDRRHCYRAQEVQRSPRSRPHRPELPSRTLPRRP